MAIMLLYALCKVQSGRAAIVPFYRHLEQAYCQKCRDPFTGYFEGHKDIAKIKISITF